VLSFATRYINWRGEQVAATLRALAAASVGQARSAMLLAAAQTKADPALSTNGIVNRGSVQALAPLRGQADKYAVVTLETTSGSAAYAGLPASWHVTIATVTERPGGWVVSGWQPQT
jgi:hypothetical protein